MSYNKSYHKNALYKIVKEKKNDITGRCWIHYE